MKRWLCIPLLLLWTFANAQDQHHIQVYFEFDKSELSSAAIQQLDRLPEILTPGSTVSLFGHCDSRGTDAYNERLSGERVNAVRDYLLTLGIPEEIIIDTKALGETSPLNANRTEQERQQNRRVELALFIPRKKGPSQPDTISTKAGNESKLARVFHDSLVEGSVIALHNINFVGGMARIIPESVPKLEELLAIMKSRPTLVIEVQGHICCQNGPQDGYDSETGIRNLSVARAKAIVEFLVKNGIERSRLSYTGFGHSRPIYPFPENNNQEELANRRVEIKIVRK